MQTLQNRKIFIFLVVVSLVVASNLSYRYFFKVPKIRIAVSEWGGYAPAVYAEVLGLYAQNSLPIQIVKSSGPMESNEWISSEKVEGVGSVLTDAISLRGSGVPAKVLLFADFSEKADSIVSLPEIKSISQLRGKTIGIDGLNSFSHVFVLQILKKYGLSERDVFFKVVNYGQVTELLQKKQIQAAHTWDPELRKALENGFQRIATAGDVPGTIIDCFIFNEDVIKENPDIMKKFIAVFYEAQKKMLENPHEAAEQMKYFFKNDPDAFAASFKDLHFVDEEENYKRIKSDGEDSFYSEALKINNYFLKRGQTNDSTLHEDIISRGLYE